MRLIQALKNSCLLLVLITLAACQRGPEAAAELVLNDWVVVNYWAIWCAPCRKEIPELNHFASNNRANVTVIGVNSDDVRGDALQAQIQELNIQFANPEQAPAAIAALAKPGQLPTTYILYKGELRATLLGPQTLATLQAAITSP